MYLHNEHDARADCISIILYKCYFRQYEFIPTFDIEPVLGVRRRTHHIFPYPLEFKINTIRLALKFYFYLFHLITGRLSIFRIRMANYRAAQFEMDGEKKSGSCVLSSVGCVLRVRFRLSNQISSEITESEIE